MPNEHPESVFMLFVAISSIFISLFKGHVACWNFCLTGSPYTQLFLHPLPRETRWGTPDVKWHGWSNGGKNQNLKKIPTNPKPPKKSHGGFVSLKNFQKALNLITRKIPKTYSPNFLIRKNPGIKTFELKKILRSSLHLKFGVPPCRAANNGRSTDNVRPNRGLDRSNSGLASHFDRSFLDTHTLFSIQLSLNAL